MSSYLRLLFFGLTAKLQLFVFCLPLNYGSETAKQWSPNGDVIVDYRLLRVKVNTALEMGPTPLKILNSRQKSEYNRGLKIHLHLLRHFFITCPLSQCLHIVCVMSVTLLLFIDLPNG